MNNLTQERFHVGAYGIFINQERVLLIKKSRGAYKGMYDLPGGKIEFGEKIEAALKREFIEETGIVLDSYSFVGYNEHFCDYQNEQDELRKLHHIGIYFSVEASSENIKTEADGHDSLGAEFIALKDLDKIEIAPIARPMIEKVVTRRLIS